MSAESPLEVPGDIKETNLECNVNLNQFEFKRLKQLKSSNVNSNRSMCYVL